MNAIFKMTSCILFSLLIFFFTSSTVFAEAGLSEAFRTEYFLANDRVMIEILPGGEGGEGFDSISLWKYIDRHTPWWKMWEDQYVSDGSGFSLYGHPSKINGTYVYDEKIIIDIKNAQKIYESEYSDSLCDEIYKNGDIGHSCGFSVEKELHRLGVDLSKSEDFTYEYIRTHFTPADLQGISADFSFMLLIILIIMYGPVVLIFGIIVFIFLKTFLPWVFRSVTRRNVSKRK